MITLPTDRTARIAFLNDLCRTAPGVAGQWLQTRGIAALDMRTQSAIREAVETFSTFTPDNDPYDEHDFGCVTVRGQRCFWKIDYYDSPACEFGSEDPSDPAQTHRVLTLMLAEEY